MFAITASTLIGAGVAVLYARWRSALPPVARLLGWSFVFVGAGLWSQATGNDRGVAIALIVTSVSALICVALSAILALRDHRLKHQRQPDMNQRRSKRAVRRDPQGAAKGRSLRERLALALLAGPCAGALAFTVALAGHQLSIRAGALPANALVSELFLFPVLWSVLAIWSLMTESLSKHSGRMALYQIGTGFLLLATGY